jgi:hypothetical protein
MSRVIVQQPVAPLAARLGGSASRATLREWLPNFSQFEAKSEAGTQGASVEEGNPEGAERGLPDWERRKPRRLARLPAHAAVEVCVTPQCRAS